MGSNIKILAIDTSCDETAVSVVKDTNVLSNIIWSQASLHAKWGGVFPSLAKREHEERIDFVIEKAIKNSKLKVEDLDAIAVTVGPGLAIALEVGIKKAKELAVKTKIPLIAVNHIEGHLLSVLASKKRQGLNTIHPKLITPALALIASGGTTQFVLVKEIGKYEVLAKTIDDSLGEALDKGARMLGLGYPGGAIIEKWAKLGNTKAYPLPIPLVGQKDRLEMSFSGLKTAMYKLIEKEEPLTKEGVQNLAASYQDKAFAHIENTVQKILKKTKISSFIFGGGVSANLELRKRIRRICISNQIPLLLPNSKNLCTDNAAMIGVVAYYKFNRGVIVNNVDFAKIDRVPRAKVDSVFAWEV